MSEATERLQRRLKEIRAKSAKLEAELARVNEEMEKLDDLPPEPLAGSVVRFTHTFKGQVDPYVYCAVRAYRSSTASACWHATGNHFTGRGPVTWEEIVAFADPDSLVLYTTWRRL